MSQIQEKHPRLIVVDYTTPYCVNGECNSCPTVACNRGLARGGGLLVHALQC